MFIPTIIDLRSQLFGYGVALGVVVVEVAVEIATLAMTWLRIVSTESQTFKTECFDTLLRPSIYQLRTDGFGVVVSFFD